MPSSVIAEDLIIDGNLKSSEGSVEVKGQITGNVTALSIVVRAEGTAKGDFLAKTVIIEGTYKGALKCDDLTVTSTARVEGQISTKTMTAENGVELNGKVQITGKA